MRLAVILFSALLLGCGTTHLLQSEPDAVVDLGDVDPLAVADCVEGRILADGHVLDHSRRAENIAILGNDAPSWGVPTGAAWLLRFTPGRAELLGRSTLQGPIGLELLPLVRECAGAGIDSAAPEI